jgi:REP element-mobilizing transposase RayT
MVLTEWGKIAEKLWYEIPDHFENVLLDEFIVMPNHVHGILVILAGERGTIVGVQHAVPLKDTSESQRINVKPGSLGAIVRSYKSAVSRYINQQRRTPGASIWQRNYYDHIVQNIEELYSTRKYILNNPKKWVEDKYHLIEK